MNACAYVIAMAENESCKSGLLRSTSSPHTATEVAERGRPPQSAVGMDAFMHECVCVCACVRVCACARVHVCVCRARVCMCVCVYPYDRTCAAVRNVHGAARYKLPWCEDLRREPCGDLHEQLQLHAALKVPDLVHPSLIDQ